ncbi:unnamed protein product [Rhizophagus irregularis]|nr:unnamed protein product [Rhizophagus irregularis]
MKNVNSINELAKKFEDIVLEESNLIRKESIVALKHIATGKYLSSISNLRYTTGSKSQLVFVGSSEPDPNSLWKISFGSDKSPSNNHIEVSCDNFNNRNSYCHDIQFTIGNDTFQEVVCHNERLGGNDEWCIELIHEVKIF